MKHPPLRSRRVVLLAASAALAAGIATVPAGSAQSAAGSCPAAFPVRNLADGQPVTGLTVSKGVTPDPFTGSVVGVIDDGIAAGIPLVVTRLSSPEVTRVGGIWAGMSGSPVYAADGRLVGAVAYTMSAGPSTVAGVTPARQMRKLLTTAPSARTDVTLPRAIARRLVSSGAVTRTSAAQGLTRMPLPLGVSGLTSDRLLRQARKRLGGDHLLVHRAAGTSRRATPVPIVAGGNLAVSASYGDITVAGIGTATAVCGDRVLGFGHPAFFTGRSTATMHGARAVYVQDDPTFGPYKIANPAAPGGAITHDGLVGVLGVVGPPPRAMPISSHVESADGSAARAGRTDVSIQDFVPDLAFLHLASNLQRVRDGVGKGSTLTSWTVHGLRADGTPFRYTRSDRFADRYDPDGTTAGDLAQQLFTLQQSDVEDITFTGVSIRGTVLQQYDKLVVAKLEQRVNGTWTAVRPSRTLALKPGTTKRLRVTLTSNHGPAGTITRVLKVPVPDRAAGREGTLDVFGGNTVGQGGRSATSLDQLLRRIRTAPRNDDIIARLVVSRPNGAAVRETTRELAPAVVDGFVSVPVRVTR